MKVPSPGNHTETFLAALPFNETLGSCLMFRVEIQLGNLNFDLLTILVVKLLLLILCSHFYITFVILSIQ